MNKLVALLIVAFSATAVHAAEDCASRAAEKKLAGAAKNSFMKKCEADTAKASGAANCEATAKEKKLAGAAKNSFMKKCVADAQAEAGK